MNDNRDRSSNEPKPPFVNYIDEVIDDFAFNMVDFSWLEDYDLNKLQALKTVLTYELVKMTGKEENCPYWNEEDLITMADSAARGVCRILSLLRRQAGEEALFVLLHTISRQCYEAGVRDAFAERLSSDSMRAITRGQEKLSSKEDELLEYYEGLQLQ